MLSWQIQLREGYLVCPRSLSRLIERDGILFSLDGRYEYAIVEGVPQLLANPAHIEVELRKHSGAMRTEYTRANAPSLLRRLYRAALNAAGDGRTPQSERALARSIDGV